MALEAISLTLDQLPEPTAAEPTPLERVNARAGLTDADLYLSVRAAVGRECGRWSDRQQTRSDYERDALAQTVALAVWADPLLLARLRKADRALRFSTLRNLVRDQLRDSRGWLDSVDGWRPRPGNSGRQTVDGKRVRVRQRVPVNQTLAEQAETFRQADRDAGRARGLLTSLDALAERHTDLDGHTDWLAVAGDQQAEQQAEEALPPVALAEHSRELAVRMADALADRYRLTPRDADRLTVCLLIASGETVATLTRDRVHGSVDKVKKAAQKGRKILAERAIDPAELVRVRRAAVAELGLAEPEPDPDPLAGLIAAAEQAVSRASEQERDRLLAYLSGASQPNRETVRPGSGSIPLAAWTVSRQGQRPEPATRTGQPREVLAYIDAMLILCQLPVRISREQATGQPRPRPTGQTVQWRSAAISKPLRAWRPILPASTRASDRNVSDTARRCWPDRITGGQPHYSDSHPARVSEAWTRTRQAEQADQPLTGQRCPVAPKAD